MQATNINAYYMELQEAEKDLAQKQGHVNTLKETIATMEQSAREASGEAAPEADQSVEDLEKLKRDELEAKAADAGVEDPSAAKNKHELAQKTVDAKSNTPNAPVESNVAAQDASLPPTSGTDEPVNNDVPSQPLVDTPEGSDMPPVSSEVQPEVSNDDVAPEETPETVAADEHTAEKAKENDPTDAPESDPVGGSNNPSLHDSGPGSL